MDKATKDLIKLIDQLVILHRENPGLLVPDKEKHRLETAVYHLLNRLTFSSKAWERIKPFNPEPTGKIEQRKKDFHHDRVKEQIKETNDLNRDIINETEGYKKKIKTIQNEMRISFAAFTEKLPARTALKVCKKCGTRFTEGEYDKHIKTCGKKKNNKN